MDKPTVITKSVITIESKKQAVLNVVKITADDKKKVPYVNVEKEKKQ